MSPLSCLHTASPSASDESLSAARCPESLADSLPAPTQTHTMLDEVIHIQNLLYSVIRLQIHMQVLLLVQYPLVPTAFPESNETTNIS